MAVWEQVLLGVGALIMVFMFWPGVKATMARSREAEERDWQGFMVPIGLVILFVGLLIYLARN